MGDAPLVFRAGVGECEPSSGHLILKDCDLTVVHKHSTIFAPGHRWTTIAHTVLCSDYHPSELIGARRQVLGQLKINPQEGFLH